MIREARNKCLRIEGLKAFLKFQVSHYGAATLSIMILSIMTFSITILSLKGLFVTLSINDI